jgi:hypothetical protein
VGFLVFLPVSAPVLIRPRPVKRGFIGKGEEVAANGLTGVVGGDPVFLVGGEIREEVGVHRVAYGQPVLNRLR